MSHGDSIDAPALLYSNRTKQPFGGHSLSRGQRSGCITQLHTFPHHHSNCNEEVKCAIVLLNGHDRIFQSLIVISFLVIDKHLSLSFTESSRSESESPQSQVYTSLLSSPLPHQVLHSTTQEAPRKPPSILSMKSSIPSLLMIIFDLPPTVSIRGLMMTGLASCPATPLSLIPGNFYSRAIANADTTVVSYGVLG